MGWGLRKKKFNIMEIHWKILFLRIGEFTKNSIYREALSEKGGLESFKRGLCEKEEDVFEGKERWGGGGLTPLRTLCP